MLDYDMANIVTDTEVTELLEKAEELRELVEQWITTHYPHLLGSVKLLRSSSPSLFEPIRKFLAVM